jgi:hypothetical protein
MTKTYLPITTEHLADMMPDLLALVNDAGKAHLECSRKATVTARFTIRRNPETAKRELAVSFGGDEPRGAANSYKRKLRPLVLAAFADDHPGQQKIDQ